MTNNIDKQSFGRSGATYATDGETISGDFCALQFLAATDLTSITWPELTGTFTTDSIAAGTVIYGQITGFTIGVGSVVAYHQTK